MSLIIKKFSASWCTHCPALSKTLQLALNELTDVSYILHPIDVEEDDDAARFYNVRNLPTVILLKDDVELFRFTGTRTKDQLIGIIKEYV